MFHRLNQPQSRRLVRGLGSQALQAVFELAAKGRRAWPVAGQFADLHSTQQGMVGGGRLGAVVCGFGPGLRWQQVDDGKQRINRLAVAGIHPGQLNPNFEKIAGHIQRGQERLGLAQSVPRQRPLTQA